MFTLKLRAIARMFLCVLLAVMLINGIAWLLANVTDATSMSRHSYTTPMRETLCFGDCFYPVWNMVLLPQLKISQVSYFRGSYYLSWLGLVVSESLVFFTLTVAIAKLWRRFRGEK